MRLLLTFLVWLAALPALASSSLPVDTGKVVAQLLSDHRVVAPGQKFQVALSTRLDPKWHTYWRNPGDSGEPVQIGWTLPPQLSAGDIVWPRPDAIPTGPIINYGFESTPLFPVEFTVSDRAQTGAILEIEAEVYYLVCKDVCIPEQGTLRMVIEVGEPSVNAKNSRSIQRALDAAPKPSAVRAAMEQSGETLTLEFANLPDGDFSEAYFFPYDNTLLNHSEPQRVSLVEDGLVITVPASFGWGDGFETAQGGLLAFDQGGDRTGVLIEVAPNASLGLVAPSAVQTGANTGDTMAAPGGDMTLWAALFGAFLGGLILNLMPCVFPVISLKALSLAKSAHAERSVMRDDAWAYAAGVFATFAVLVAVLLAIKAGGELAGWGFQLQNPVIVGVLALLMFAIGLNLIGAFEIAGGGYQGLGSGLVNRGGRLGSFFVGALAVIVATPCTAPFMAGAIGYALAQPALATVSVFMALAAGFALPFILLAYVPGVLAKLPRPGPWMIRLREVLSFPVFATAIWLVWVVSGQAGSDGVLIVLALMLLLAFAIWLLRVRKPWGVAAIVGLIALMWFPLSHLSGAQARQVEAASSDTASNAWSPDAVAELRADGRAVFVDFTADWCVTCKVNERTTLNRAEVREAFARTNTAFLVGDWTNKNDAIAAELARYGRAGVPLYLYFPAGDNSVMGQVLPQVLTVSMVVDVLEKTSS